MTAEFSLYDEVDQQVVVFKRDTQAEAEAAADSWSLTGSPDPDEIREFEPGDQEFVDRAAQDL